MLPDGDMTLKSFVQCGMNKGPDLPEELLATYHVFPRSFQTAERVRMGGWGVALLLYQAFLSATTTGCLLRLKVALAARATSLGQSVPMTEERWGWC